MNNIFDIAETIAANGLPVREVLPRNIELDEPHTIDLMNGVIITMTDGFEYFTCQTMDFLGTSTNENGDTVHHMRGDDLGEYESLPETIEAIKRITRLN